MLFIWACASPDPKAVPPSKESEVIQDSSYETSDSPVDSHPPDSPVDTQADSPTETVPTTWRSLLYPEDWTPSFTDQSGHFLHDFSYAGYRASEVPLPTLSGTVYEVDSFGADPGGSSDSTAAVQAAIDAAYGSGGVVHFSKGTYRMDGRLNVNASNVVLDGEGSSSTFLYFTTGTGVSYAAHLSFSGNLKDGAEYPLALDAKNRATTVQIMDASGLEVGQEVAIGWVISDAFIAEHGMTGTWVSFNGQWKPFFRRTITAIDSSQSPAVVTVDVPFRYDAKLRDAASLRVQTGYLTECGLQEMSLSNVNTWEVAWAESQTHMLLLSEVKDCWVRDVASWESPLSTDGRGKHMMSGGIEVLDSRRVTIAETHLANAQNRGDGGNGYLFEISRSNEILTRDSSASAGRHNFIQNWDFGTSGCVWLRDHSSDGRSLLADWDPIGYPSYSEFHHSLAMANLIDSSIAEDGWQGVNRQSESSGAGHSVTQSVFWNMNGGGYLRSLQYGDGYVIGTDGMDLHVDPAELDWNNSGEGTDPQDWTEGLDQGPLLVPASLLKIN